MDDADAEGLLQNYEMYKAEGDLHLKKGLLAKAVDNYTKVCGVSNLYYRPDAYVFGRGSRLQNIHRNIFVNA